jgi:hypothetical protein
MIIPDTHRTYGDIIVQSDPVRKALLMEFKPGEVILDEELFSNDTVELKTHSWEQVQETGNFFIEFEALYPEQKNYKPSGIMVTHAPYWVFNFKDETGFKSDIVLCVRTETLFDVIQRGLERGLVKIGASGLLPTGDQNNGYLVPIMLLLREFYYITPEHVLDNLNSEREKWIKRKTKLMLESLNKVRKKLFGNK